MLLKLKMMLFRFRTPINHRFTRSHAPAWECSADAPASTFSLIFTVHVGAWERVTRKIFGAPFGTAGAVLTAFPRWRVGTRKK
jgi:hypothetical protein